MANQKKQPVYEEQAQSGAPLTKLLCAIACFGIAVLMVYICVAQPQPETSMGAIRDVMRGVGGSLSPLLALVLVWTGVLLVCSFRGKKMRILNIIMDSILFLCGFTLVQLFCAENVMGTLRLTDFFNFVSRSYQHGAGGGALGALLAFPLYKLGKVGGTIVILLVCLICLAATGKAQKFHGWVMRRAEDGQHHIDQRRKQQNAERLFDYDADDYDEYDGFGAGRPMQRRPRPQPQRPERSAERRTERRSDPARDYMIIDTPAPAPRRKPRAEAASPSPAKGRKKLYKEIIDEEAAMDQVPETGVDIPKPLNQLKKEHPEIKTEVPEEKRPKRSRSKFPRDIPDFFNVEAENAAEDVPAVQKEESDAFAPVNYESKKVKPKRVVEGVQPLTIDDIIPQPEPEEDDDEAPFDIPHTAEVKAPRFIRKKEESLPEADIYHYPPISLLQQGSQQKNSPSQKEDDNAKAKKLVDVLASFGIDVRHVGTCHGPVVTQFELQPAPGIKLSRITALADDIALGLAAMSVRIEAPIPGKAAIGVEIPNDKTELVCLRDLLESPEAKKNPSKLAVALGKDNSGRCIIADIAKMPHVLVAGSTGSGKSVCINAIITSILYRATPDEVRMILIDPKMVELQVYNDIPHLIAPVVTDAKKAASALEWAVAEMLTRYKRFSDYNVRDIKGYNKVLPPDEPKMPQIVIIIDELADLMTVASASVTESIMRLAQLARAAGIHLVIATQRPSVDVFPGIIKNNVPTRIAFKVSSQADSRTIIDHGGAEKLLGNGDMLFIPPGTSKFIRAQGTYVSDDEVLSIVNYIKARSETSYDEDVVEKIETSVLSDAEKEDRKKDEKYALDDRIEEAIEIAFETGQVSTSMLQSRMRLGYARARRIISDMTELGIITEQDGTKPRTVIEKLTLADALAMIQ